MIILEYFHLATLLGNTKTHSATHNPACSAFPNKCGAIRQPRQTFSQIDALQPRTPGPAPAQPRSRANGLLAD